MYTHKRTFSQYKTKPRFTTFYCGTKLDYLSNNNPIAKQKFRQTLNSYPNDPFSHKDSLVSKSVVHRIFMREYTGTVKRVFSIDALSERADYYVKVRLIQIIDQIVLMNEHISLRKIYHGQEVVHYFDPAVDIMLANIHPIRDMWFQWLMSFDKEDQPRREVVSEVFCNKIAKLHVRLNFDENWRTNLGHELLHYYCHHRKAFKKHKIYDGFNFDGVLNIII